MKQIREQPYRYVNLIVFVLAGAINAFPINAFTAIAPIMKRVYEVDELYVNLNGLIYSIMYVFMVFPVNYILETYGLKIGTLIGQMCFIVGLLTRLLINVHFTLFLVGTFITGFGFCFMLNSPNKFANTWFPVRQISFVNSICLFAVFASDSLGSFISSLFVKEDSTKQSIFHFFLVETIIMICIQLLMVIFFKGKPKYPPNYASETPRQSYIQSLKKLVKNKNYQVLFLSITFVYGFLGVYFSNISWQTKAYGFTSDDTGQLILCSNIAGLVSCSLIGFVLDSQNYRNNTIKLAFGATFCLGIVWIALQSHQKWLLLIGAGASGIFMFPYLTTITDFASQTAFPIGQAISAGFIFFGGQLFGVVCAVMGTQLFFDGKSVKTTRMGAGFELLLMIIGSSVLFWSKNKLNRSQYEKQKQEDEKGSLISNQM